VVMTMTLTVLSYSDYDDDDDDDDYDNCDINGKNHFMQRVAVCRTKLRRRLHRSKGRPSKMLEATSCEDFVSVT